MKSSLICAVALVALVAAAATTLGADPANARPDTTPPHLVTPLKAGFVVGSQLGQWKDYRGEYFSTMPERISWKAKDDSGSRPLINIYEHYAHRDPRLLALFVAGRSFDVQATDFAEDANSKVTDWSVEARDASSNSTENVIYGANPVVRQDNGSVTAGRFVPGFHLSFNKRGWRTTHCGCFSAGTTRLSTTRGDAAVIKVKVSAAQDVRHLALVSQTGPFGSKAAISVDGGKSRVVDTYSASPHNRVVVWQTRLDTGRHRVRVVNRATHRRARFDVDAVIVN